MHRSVIAWVLVICLLFGGCYQAPADEPAPTPTASAEALIPPAPTPAPTLEARTETLNAAFRAALQGALVPPEYTPSLTMAEVMEQVDIWKQWQQMIAPRVEAAFALACGECGETAGTVQVALPSWKLVASIFHRFGEQAQHALASGSLVEIVPRGDVFDVEIRFDDFEAVLAGCDAEARYGVGLSYCYANTLYDDDGLEKDYEEYPFAQGYLETLVEPLPGKRIKNGWYKPRQKATRKHTGTDIRAPEGTDILSCSDGVILYIGSNEGAGNYVVVQDDYGFTYHYYHMVRLTDFRTVGERVSAGDIIGNVGNTGNSDANHLHLGVVSPEYSYINPFSVLVMVRAYTGGKGPVGKEKDDEVVFDVPDIDGEVPIPIIDEEVAPDTEEGGAGAEGENAGGAETGADSAPPDADAP